MTVKKVTVYDLPKYWFTELSFFFKEEHHTVRNKDYLDNGIKTKTSNLPL